LSSSSFFQARRSTRRNNNDTVPETVVSESEPIIDYPEFLLFDFFARGLAHYSDEVVEGFFERLRVAIQLIRAANEGA
jgi:hypothetical protein